MQVREVLSTRGLGLGFLAFFSWIYEQVRGLARAHRADGLGEFIWILCEFGIQKPDPGSSD